MNKILIFYGSYGGGHLSAARNIKDYIENNYQNSEILMVDCIEYINKILNKVTTKAYTDFSKNARWIWKQIYYGAESGSLSKISNSINRVMAIKLNKIIQDFKPDLIISTHPFSSQMCAILKEKEKINCKLATIMTDYAPHSQWLVAHEFVDFYFVAHEGMREDLINRGVDKTKIHTTGIPLSNRFLLHYDKVKVLGEYNLSPDKKTILFFAGGEFGFGKDKTFNMLKSIIDNFPNLQIIAIAGRNEKMKEPGRPAALDKRAYFPALAWTLQSITAGSSMAISRPWGMW